MATVKVTPVLQAVLSHLATETGLAVGDGATPSGRTVDAAGRPTEAWLEVYGIPGLAPTGSIDNDDRYADGRTTVQITAVGATGVHASAARDLARSAMCDTPMTVSGQTVLHVELLSEGTGQPDHDIETGEHRAADLYRIHTTTS